jgi:hypothetical protein
LEQNADIVIGLYRRNREDETLEILGLKGRDVGTFRTYLNFDLATQRITDMADPEIYEPPGERIPQGGYDG